MKTKIINELLKQYKSDLLQQRNRKKLLLTPEWKSGIPKEAGVYAIFKKGGKDPIYVGEGRSLQKRIVCLKNTGSHTFRKSFGNKLLSRNNDSKKITSKLRFSNKEEKLINKEMTKLYLSTISVPFGRKEVEEYLILEYMNKPTNKRNKKQLE